MNNNRLMSLVMKFTAVSLLFGVSAAEAGGGIAGVADTVTSAMGSLARLVTAAAYVAGMGFAVAAILKFKQHKDNPTQIPLGTPIALLFVGAALIFLPNIFSIAGESLGFQSGNVGSVSGVTSF